VPLIKNLKQHYTESEVGPHFCRKPPRYKYMKMINTKTLWTPRVSIPVKSSVFVNFFCSVLTALYVHPTYENVKTYK